MKMIKRADEIKDDRPQKVYRNKQGCYSDTIYTFDIETTSLFLNGGKWGAFDRTPVTKENKKYLNVDKCAVPYIGMFSVNNTVYGFRNMYLLEDILKHISNPKITKFVYVHNLGYETQFYLWLIKKYTITDMIARKPRAPIQYHIKELNITFRCSYALTNLSLDKSAKRYTNIEKKDGQKFDYSILRSYKSKLSDYELSYCEYDCLCLYEIIKTFRKEYKHIKQIPLTQTGETRRELQKHVVPKTHNRFIISLCPSVVVYKRLRELFAGGVCHANYNKLRLIFAGWGWDICSSYPFEMASKKVPMEKFTLLRNLEKLKDYPDSDYAKIYVLKLTNVKSKLFNSFLQVSKLRKYKGLVNDNGRAIKVDECEITCNEIDKEVIEMCYDCDIDILECWVAKKDYLPDYLINFILDLYVDKTRLKGVTDSTGYTESIYLKKKQMINGGTYGACVTNIVKSSIIFNNDGWKTGELTDEFIKIKLDEIKKGYNNLFSYAWGCWVTSYSRRHLIRPIATTKIDECVGYFDTDSHKNDENILSIEEQRKIYEKENRRADIELLQMCVARGIDFKKTRPKDIKGIEHPLGHYECEGHFSEFKTLGAKRYCYRNDDGELKITVAGVGKRGVIALKNDINNFNEQLVFDYDTAFKNCSYYVDDQKPIDFIDNEGNKIHSEWQSSIAIAPTTYSMSVPDIYNLLAGAVVRRLSVDENFLELYKQAQKDRKKLR